MSFQFRRVILNCLRNSRKYGLVDDARRGAKISKVGNIQRFRNIAAFTGFGTTLIAASVVVPKEEVDNNVVYSVYGALRFLRSLQTGIWISMDYFFSMLGLKEGDPNYEIMMSRIHKRAACNILRACLENGGPYIKLGQGLVAMSHILPKEYIQVLSALQDKCLVRHEGELYDIFQSDFGKAPNAIFKDFDYEPIAAASLAQVYKATTKDDQEVAVKVQYIDLQSRFHSDVATINFLLKIAGVLHPHFDFAWVLDDLKETLEEELDFVNEGKNAEKCAEDLAHFKFVYVPKVFWDYCSPRILVTEFIDGYKINDTEELKKNKISLADVDKKLFEAFGHQIFQSGFVHADPHPGNVLVRKKDGAAELVLLDHGLYQTINEKDRKALSEMWRAIVFGNHQNMEKYSKDLGVENCELFAEILVQAPLKYNNLKLKHKLTDDDIKVMTKFAKNRFDMVMKCLQEMPRSLLLILRNLNTIRAIAHDHGDPIDRFSVLARVATESTFHSSSLLQNLLNIPKRGYFEFILLVNKISRWIINILMAVMIRLNLIPDYRSAIKVNMMPS